jgi:hypothetical protein
MLHNELHLSVQDFGQGRERGRRNRNWCRYFLIRNIR